MGRLSGKVAIVTGAAMGNGKGGAEAYAKHGAHVVLCDVSPVLFETEKEFKEKGYSVSTAQFDVRDGAACRGAVDKVVADYGKVDILLNNAGIAKLFPFMEMTDEMRDLHLDINVKGIWNMARAVWPHMLKAKYGKIVNLASVSAFGNVGQTNYGASKGGVIGFTKCLAREVARNGCTVNCIAPSYINTEMLQAVPEQTMQRFLAAIPMERLGEPEELAAAAAFLCSDDSSFVTGECLVVSGGSYM